MVRKCGIFMSWWQRLAVTGIAGQLQLSIGGYHVAAGQLISQQAAVVGDTLPVL